MNSVDLVKSICKERRIPISKLERDLGYANGYIGQLRKGTFPANRLSEIAQYLSVPVEYLMNGGTENKKAPTADGERSGSHDVLDDVDIAFYGDYKELTEDDKATVRDMVRIMRERRSKKQEQ